jgi:TonB family protein
MTATGPGLRQVTSNGPSPRLACTAAVAALAIAGGVLAQASGPLDIYADDSQPRRQPAVTAFPDYPAEERRDRVEGETTVCFRIDAAGQIVRPKVRSSTLRAFEKPAMAAIRESLFEPLAAGEVESPADVCRVYRFRLKPIAAANSAPPPGDTALAAAVADVATAPPGAALAPIELGYPATTAADAPLAAESASAENAATDGDAARRKTAEVTVVTSTQQDSVAICKTRRRPGSMIAATICYSPEEQIAIENAKLRTIKDFDTEQRWREQAINEARIESASPSGGNIGPSN